MTYIYIASCKCCQNQGQQTEWCRIYVLKKKMHTLFNFKQSNNNSSSSYLAMLISTKWNWIEQFRSVVCYLRSLPQSQMGNESFRRMSQTVESFSFVVHDHFTSRRLFALLSLFVFVFLFFLPHFASSCIFFVALLLIRYPNIVHLNIYIYFFSLESIMLPQSDTNFWLEYHIQSDIIFQSAKSHSI